MPARVIGIDLPCLKFSVKGSGALSCEVSLVDGYRVIFSSLSLGFCLQGLRCMVQG